MQVPCGFSIPYSKPTYWFGWPALSAKSYVNSTHSLPLHLEASLIMVWAKIQLSFLMGNLTGLSNLAWFIQEFNPCSLPTNVSEDCMALQTAECRFTEHSGGGLASRSFLLFSFLSFSSLCLLQCFRGCRSWADIILVAPYWPRYPWFRSACQYV